MIGAARALVLANLCASSMAHAVGAQYLPMRFHGHWYWLAKEAWGGLYARYEPHMATAIHRHLPHGGVFFDVGAHVGLWSLFAASVAGPRGRVVSVEPSAAFSLLQKNTRPFSQIACLNVALGDAESDAVFHGQGASMSGSLVREVTAINERYSPGVPIEAVPIRVKSLDSIAAGRGVPDLIKVDVEGYEHRVLEGARGLLDRASPVWLIEIHPPQLRECGSSDGACLRLLETQGYEVDVIDRHPNSIYTVLARRKGSDSVSG